MADHIDRRQVFVGTSEVVAQTFDLTGRPCEEDGSPIFEKLLRLPIAISNTTLQILTTPKGCQLLYGLRIVVTDSPLLIKSRPKDHAPMS